MTTDPGGRLLLEAHGLPGGGYCTLSGVRLRLDSRGFLNEETRERMQDARRVCIALHIVASPFETVLLAPVC